MSVVITYYSPTPTTYSPPAPIPTSQPAPEASWGIPGLEARHTFFSGQAGAGHITLNDLWADDGRRRVVLPPGLVAKSTEYGVGAVIKLRSIVGLHAKPETDDNRANRTAGIGERAYPSLERGKTVTYNGAVLAGSLASLRALSASLRGAFSSAAEGWMVVQYHPTFAQAQNLPWAFQARVTQFEMGDEMAASSYLAPYQREFNVALRMADPRVYLWIGRSTGSLPANGGVYSATNSGTAPAEPRFDVAGCTSTVRIGGPGGQLELLGVPEGASISVDFYNRRVTQLGTGTDLTGKLNVGASNWWDAGQPGLHPGANGVWATGASTFSVGWLDAWW